MGSHSITCHPAKVTFPQRVVKRVYVCVCMLLSSLAQFREVPPGAALALRVRLGVAVRRRGGRVRAPAGPLLRLRAAAGRRQRVQHAHRQLRHRFVAHRRRILRHLHLRLRYDSDELPSANALYDTRCYFNVRSKADVSQLNLPHGTDN